MFSCMTVPKLFRAKVPTGNSPVPGMAFVFYSVTYRAQVLLELIHNILVDVLVSRLLLF